VTLNVTLNIHSVYLSSTLISRQQVPTLADMTSDTSIDLVMVKMKNLSQESSGAGTNEDEMRESFEMVETQNTDCKCGFSSRGHFLHFLPIWLTSVSLLVLVSFG